MAVGKSVSSNWPDGVTLGIASTDKVSFFGATPAVQPSVIAAVTTTVTATATTTTLDSTVNLLITQGNAVVAALKTLGLIASA